MCLIGHFAHCFGSTIDSSATWVYRDDYLRWSRSRDFLDKPHLLSVTPWTNLISVWNHTECIQNFDYICTAGCFVVEPSNLVVCYCIYYMYYYMFSQTSEHPRSSLNSGNILIGISKLKCLSLAKISLLIFTDNSATLFRYIYSICTIDIHNNG